MTVLNKDFLWGNSTSSVQTEGGANEGGKGLSVYDVRKASASSAGWDTAIDEFHRYPEDVALMADAGMNCYRFQISWSRVNPDGDGDFNEEGIQFYSDLIDQLIDAEITPMICLYHFDMPLHLAKEYNGFMSDHVVEAFIRYGKEMLKRFASRVPYWITFNEQTHFSVPEVFNISGYTGDRSLADLYQIQQHVMTCHAAIANAIHALPMDVKVGGMLAYQEVYPYSPLPEDVAATRKFNEFVNLNLLDLFTRGDYSQEVLSFMKKERLDGVLDEDEMEVISQCRSDFISFSYYATTTMDSTKIPITTVPNFYLQHGNTRNPFLQSNEWDWQIDPLGFRTVLTTISDYCNLPVFPIENGIGAREVWDGNHEIDDEYRIAYHREHIQALKDAVSIDGVKCLGYLGWGMIDIPSSKGDMEKRYGLVYVNRGNHELRDLKRIPKKSYYWFKQVTKSNGECLG